MNPYPDYRIAVEAIIVHEGKVLLAKRADNGAWYVPAGKAKYEETPKEAVIREVREETNLKGVGGFLQRHVHLSGQTGKRRHPQLPVER